MAKISHISIKIDFDNFCNIILSKLHSRNSSVAINDDSLGNYKMRMPVYLRSARIYVIV